MAEPIKLPSGGLVWPSGRGDKVVVRKLGTSKPPSLWDDIADGAITTSKVATTEISPKITTVDMAKEIARAFAGLGKAFEGTSAATRAASISMDDLTKTLLEIDSTRLLKEEKMATRFVNPYSMSARSGPASEAARLAAADAERRAAYYRLQSITLAFEEYPRFLGVKLEPLRLGRVPEHGIDKRIGGQTKWQPHWRGEANDLIEIIHNSGWRRDQFGSSRGYSDAIESQVNKWSDRDHVAFAEHLEKVTGHAASLDQVRIEAEERARKAEMEKAKRDKELAMQVKEHDRLAGIAREKKIHEDEERELAEAVAFQVNIDSGAGGW